jgi:hypothetical protein
VAFASIETMGAAPAAPVTITPFVGVPAGAVASGEGEAMVAQLLLA